MGTPIFFQNKPDNNHCLQAAVMMVLNTIVGKTSWNKVNKITQYENGLYSWVPATVVELSKQISGVKLLSNLDYNEFSERGEEYLKSFFDPQWFKLQKSHASPGFKKEQAAAKQLVECNLVKLIKINKKMVEELLVDNLLIVLIDAGKLAGKNSSNGHFIVVYDQKDDVFCLHDPGLPPQKSVFVNKEKFIDAYCGELIIIPWSQKIQAKT